MEESTSLDRLFEIMSEMVQEQKKFNEKIKLLSERLEEDESSREANRKEIIESLEKLIKKSFE